MVGFAWTRVITGSWSGEWGVLDFSWGFQGWRFCIRWGGLGVVGGRINSIGRAT